VKRTGWDAFKNIIVEAIHKPAPHADRERKTLLWVRLLKNSNVDKTAIVKKDIPRRMFIVVKYMFLFVVF